mmetsp:Transcript_27806/g.65275  ORF Transcript_27806/g.65275 Transcript_27806/m.65275 type:complete len:213 (-) Transcript_27806:1461-2099(-)
MHRSRFTCTDRPWKSRRLKIIIVNIIDDIVLIIEKVCARPFLFHVLLRALLVDSRSEVDRISSECNLKTLQELVHTRKQALWRGSRGFDAGLPGVHHNAIGEVCCHDEVVLDHKGSLLAVHDESLNDLGAVDTLLGVEVCTGLVNEVNIGGGTEGQNDGKSLKLTTRKCLNTVIDDIVNHEGLHHIRNELGVNIGVANTLVEQLSDSALELG